MELPAKNEFVPDQMRLSVYRIATGRQYATESTGTFVQKCVLSGAAAAICLAAAWPADRVRLRLEIS
eukprot:COSAG01_NODE_58157_length_307_cov_4.980769_1_plen_66_part_10